MNMLFMKNRPKPLHICIFRKLNNGFSVVKDSVFQCNLLTFNVLNKPQKACINMNFNNRTDLFRFANVHLKVLCAI